MTGRSPGRLLPLCPMCGARRASPSPSVARGFFTAVSLLVLGAFCVPAAEAQTGTAFVGGGAVFETYRFQSTESIGLRSITLRSLPFSAGVELRPALRLEVAGAYASGRIERADGSTAGIGGLTDTQVQLQTIVGADRVRLTAVLELPTGHSRYTVEEAEAAGAIAADVLPFQVSEWGRGGALGVQSSVARRVGDFGLGASASYLVGREFEVFAGEDIPFRPGSQLALGLVGDRTVGQAAKAALHLQMVRYGDDELEGSNLYRSGSRYQAVGSYAFAAPRYSSAMVFAGVMHRTRGRFFQLSEEMPSQNLIRAGAVARMSFGWGTLVPSADLRALRSADGIGQGYVGSVGASVERETHGMILVPTLRTRIGRIVAFEGERSGIWGIDLGLTARLGGGL